MDKIYKIGIIGKGKMGSDIFNYLYLMDFQITWICRTQEDCDRLNQQVQKKLNRMYKGSGLEGMTLEEKMKLIRISTDMKLLEDANLIIETVTEDLNIKMELLGKVSRIVQDDCIITTNSSSISLEDVFSKVTGIGRCFGLHFYYPLMLMNIVEINVPDNYDYECFSMLTRFLEMINKKYLLLTKQAHFLLNRIYITLVSVAVMIYDNNSYKAKELDEILKDGLLPLGLLGTLSSAGTFIMSRATKNLTDERNRVLFTRLAEFAEMLYNSGYRGGSGSKGIYEYDDDNKKEKKVNENSFNLNDFKPLIFSVLINEIATWSMKGYADLRELSRSMKTILGLTRDPLDEIAENGLEMHINLLEKIHISYNCELFKPIGLNKLKLNV